jgi:two-component system response regulator GlrR
VDAKPRILLVDDEPGLLRIFHTALKIYGYEVAGCTSAAEALERLGQETFDLVLSDVNMPKCGGLELLQMIRKLHPMLPVIVMTGRPSPEVERKALEHGAQGFLVKPIMPANLRAAIEAALKH